MKKKVFFRADADTNIGYGHFVRTLALADILKNEFDCTFFTQKPTEYQITEINKVCKCVSLPADETRFRIFLDKLQGEEIVVLDNYFFSTEYQQRIKEKGCKLVCIDDTHTKHFVSDAIINHSLGIQECDYSKEEYTKLYLGLEYALLRSPFIEACKESNCRNNRDNIKVFISFGGADKYGIAESLSSELEHLDLVEEIFLISLQKTNMKTKGKITYLSNLSAQQMKDLLFYCNLAIIPSSTIMKEAIACGIDIVGGYFVDNQINSYNQFCKINAIKGFGDLTESKNQQLLIQYIKEGHIKNLSLSKNIILPTIVNNLINIFKTL